MANIYQFSCKVSICLHVFVISSKCIGISLNKKIINLYHLQFEIKSIAIPTAYQIPSFRPCFLRRQNQYSLVLETKSAELVNLKDGARSTLNMASFENGTVTYTFECAAGSLNPEDVEIVPPTLYVEEQAEETMVIPLTGDSYLIDLEVKDSKQVFPDAASAVLVEFTASDVATLPYNPTLVSNGETYECGASYYFDAETGAFTHGQLVFIGITVEELAANATLETGRVFNRYVPASYDLAQ